MSRALAVGASLASFLATAAFSNSARAGWTAHLDVGYGRRLGNENVGQLALRADTLLIGGGYPDWAVGLAAEGKLLHPGAGAGVVGFLRTDAMMYTATVVGGYGEGGTHSGAYVGGTLAFGLRISPYVEGLLTWSPSSAIYIGAMHRLDGSTDEIVVGVQVGLGLLTYLVGMWGVAITG
jgi:hypothetical protein